MKLLRAPMVALCLAVLLVQNPPVAALAQGDEPPVVDILGRPDTSPTRLSRLLRCQSSIGRADGSSRARCQQLRRARLGGGC